MKQTEVLSGNNQSERSPVSRRSFFKAGSTFGAAVCAQAIQTNAVAAPQPAGQSLISRRRTLGVGDSQMEVSALGFGCMGMNYHRGIHPGRETMIKLVRQAVERGVTFFDTAESYGPLTNEELVGEALAPVRKEVMITPSSVMRLAHQTVSTAGRSAFGGWPKALSDASGSRSSICFISTGSIRACPSRTSPEPYAT